jgi:hypothetical protein
LSCLSVLNIYSAKSTAGTGRLSCVGERASGCGACQALPKYQSLGLWLEGFQSTRTIHQWLTTESGDL